MWRGEGGLRKLQGEKNSRNGGTVGNGAELTTTAIFVTSVHLSIIVGCLRPKGGYELHL